MMRRRQGGRGSRFLHLVLLPFGANRSMFPCLSSRRLFDGACFRSPLHPHLCSATREGPLWSWNVRESLDRRDRVQFIGESWACTLPLKLVSFFFWGNTETGFRFARKARLNMQWWTRLFHSRAWPWFRFLKGGASDWHVCFWCATCFIGSLDSGSLPDKHRKSGCRYSISFREIVGTVWMAGQTTWVQSKALFDL
jgi:hypothetical protein